MITFQFNFQKTIQAAGVILREHPNSRMDRVRLLKLLYIADRELLVETGQTLTGDRAVAMKKGPVLCEVYELIQGGTLHAPDWNAVIQTVHYEVVLTGGVGVGKLTKAEVGKLHALCERYRDSDSEDLSELTHHFQEWVRAFDPNRPESPAVMSWESILEAQGESQLINEVEADLRQRDLVDTAFRG